MQIVPIPVNPKAGNRVKGNREVVRAAGSVPWDAAELPAFTANDRGLTAEPSSNQLSTLRIPSCVRRSICRSGSWTGAGPTAARAEFLQPDRTGQHLTPGAVG